MDPSIRNWRNSPPQGGWNIVYTPPERPGTHPIESQGHNPATVISQIVNWRVNNGLPADEAQVFSFANAEWCRRDPGRCLQAPPPPDPPAGTARRVLTPVDYGRACWTFLNTFGVSFDAIRFQQTVHQITSLLSPHNPHNNGSGCIQCYGHFQEFLTGHPPHKVQSAEQAAVWAWLAHDGANIYAGKPHRPSFRVCAAMFGWPILDSTQFAKVQTSLRA